MLLRALTTILSLASMMMGVAQTSTQNQSQRPRLVVNIIVSSLRAGDIEKYQGNMTSQGFATMMEQGLYYPKGEYNFARSAAPTTLATLSSGADPAMHGVVTSSWFNYSSNEKESLIDDKNFINIPYNHGENGYSAANVLAQSLSEALTEQSPESRTLTVALLPTEAIAIAGNSSNVFWIDPISVQWSTSTAFAKELPEWADSFNRKCQPIFNRAFSSWQPLYPAKEYLNKRYRDIEVGKYSYKKSLTQESKTPLVELINSYNRILYTPLGNTLTLEFTKAAMANLDMGKDNHTDIVNIHLCSTGAISQLYGREGLEVEDMLLRLDSELGDFIKYTKAQIKGGEVVFTFTSDSGGSSSHNLEENSPAQSRRFNATQAAVILNGFLSARHGEGNWVLGCWDSSIYLNHNTIYQNKQSVADIQDEIATFMMHFQGVAYALSATSLQSSAFNYGYGELIQRSFFMRRSGDVVITLLPGWIELKDNLRSRAGSIYRYDREVPLIIYGNGIPSVIVDNRVDMGSMAATLSKIMGIDSPTSNQYDPLKEITQIEWKK